ncbi:MAG: TerC family protein [Bacteroidota bacterium]|nr:TerC family protein [Candidatus Kapabacteria bacterium]MDW8219258.1 TerC family protein [Bacteroidota bacterium]
MITELLSSPSTWLSLVVLSAMEIVLGIDNVIFISIVVNRLPESQRSQARIIGLGLALLFRLLLLSLLSYIASMTAPLVYVAHHGITGRDIILFGGGLFLMAKTTREIHDSMTHHDTLATMKQHSAFAGVVIQIVLLDIVFSFDSVLTAIGLSNQIPIMVAAIIISLAVMLIFSGAISDFIDKNPTMKMLALSFLMLVGFLLVTESFHIEVPKGYIYFAMAFSFVVELLNMRIRKQSLPTS